MFDHPIRFRSVSATQLEEAGTQFTRVLLEISVGTFSDEELLGLEEELEFCAQTGLIGLRMSQLLATLRVDALAEAA